MQIPIVRWFVSQIAVPLFMLGSPVLALDEVCAPSEITGTSDVGMLIVAEFAITQNFSDCPTDRANLWPAFAAQEKQPIFFWLRLEGDVAFLDQLSPEHRFEATLYRKRDYVENASYLDIDKDWIAQKSALDEALANGDHFDWRMYAKAKMYLVPGEYMLEMSFGGRPLCAVGQECAIRFEVLNGDDLGR